MRNGSLKKIKVVNDGGPRSCDFLDENLKFYEVHHRLRKFFNVENYHHKSVLYNFKIEPLQFKKYKTFGDYLDRYGLSGKDSALYLCTFEGNIDDRSKREIIKKRPSTRTTTTYPSASQRTQLNPFRQSWTNNQQPNSSSTTTNSNSSVTTQSSASEYSFEHACDDLKELVRELINQNNSNQIVIQLHGNIYSTYGLIVAKIQPLNEQLNQIIAFFETLNDANMISYSNDLNNAVDSSQSIMDLLQLNKEAFERVHLYQRIFHTFSKFNNELKKLHYKWLRLVEKHKHRTISSGQQELSFRDRSSRVPNAPTDPFAHSLYHLNQLLKYLNPESLLSLRSLVNTAIDRINEQRTIINLNYEYSICDTKRVILPIKDLFERKTNALKESESISEIDQHVLYRCKKVLWSFYCLFTKLDTYQCKSSHVNQALNRSVHSTSNID